MTACRHAILTILASLAITALPTSAAAQCDAASVCDSAGDGAFALIEDGTPAPVIVDRGDHAAVVRAAESLVADLSRVGGAEGDLLGADDTAPMAIIAGSLDSSTLIQDLVEEGMIDVSAIEGEWEAFQVSVVNNPMPGMDRALVIAGSDMRGTIFGLYDLAEAAGVSPWVWWADVPVTQAEDLWVAAGSREDAPKVKYRGIFLNDEEPALGNWVRDTYGDFNADFYARVFELILRQKGNYLWPAMWGKAFYDDDAANKDMAADYGIVIGTSHHEPLMRAHVEWDRYGEGAWDYNENAETLREFWREGMERVGDEDVLVTIGMRGDGDEAMTEGTAIELLETIVADQREIIEDVTGEPASETPQIWALYKEVQDYYDQGMDVPDDVTLLFADDNWGNIRRLPDPDAPRPGGYGIYYHFDYVGGPRNYKWLNKTQNERVWEQMHLAHEYGANEIWIVNVGDLKPMEFPISFFLDYAWDPADWPLERLPEYSTLWAEQQFGEKHAGKIAEMLDLYTKYSSRRTAEMLDATTYSVVNHDEFARVTAEYQDLAERADAMLEKLPAKYEDAYRQLVWFPITASANLYELYYNVALNQLYAEQGRAVANDYANRAREAYERDAELTRIYHEKIANGKWNHMMSQTHIGYTYWQQPEEQTMPEVTEIDVPAESTLGIAVPGSTEAWPGGEGTPALPTLEPFGNDKPALTLFSTGEKRVSYAIKADAPWVTISDAQGWIDGQSEIEIGADWKKLSVGKSEATLTVSSPGMAPVGVSVSAYKPADKSAARGFVNPGGVIAMAAPDATCAVPANGIEWKEIPNLGRTGSSITMFPVTAQPQTPGEGPSLAYDFTVWEAGTYEVTVYLAPTLEFTGGDGLGFAVSLDDGAPEEVSLNVEPQTGPWYDVAGENVHRPTVTVDIDEPGQHTLHLWMIDPGTVFQKIAIAPEGEMPQSYLGAPESPYAGERRSCQ